MHEVAELTVSERAPAGPLIVPRSGACHVLAMIASLACTIPSYAQVDEPLEEIQVTATRRPVESSKVSAALTMIDAESIRFGALTTDALVGRSGVFLQQTTPGQGAAIIRGLKGSELLHVVDGMRLNNAIFRNAPTQYLALVSPATVERMEIVRGSPTSLYGSDAVGGVLQVITRTPSFDSGEVGYRRDVSAGFDTAELRKSLSASLDVGTNRAAGLVSIDYLEAGNRAIGGGDRIGPSGYESYGARAALSLTPDDRSSWLFDFQSGRQPETPRIDELVPGFGQTEPSSSEFYFAPNERHFAHVRHTRDDGLFGQDWTVDLGWQRIVDDRRSRNFGADTRRLETNSSDLLGISVTASNDIGAGMWIAGAEYYHDEVASSRRELDLVAGGIEDVQSRFPDGSTVDQAALYVHLTQDVGERHRLTGGARFNVIDIDLAATELSPPASLDVDDVSADLGWSFNLTDQTQLVANSGYGFRAPNVFDLGTLGERPGNRYNIPNPALESEHILQFDVGIKHRQRNFSTELIAWFLDYEDRITSVLTGDVTAEGRDIVQTQNVASAQIWGIEASASLVLSGGSVFELVLNQTRGEQEEAGGVVVPADRIPPVNGRLGLDADVSDTLSLQPYVLFASGQDRLSPRDADDIRIDPDGTPGWVTVNMKATWRPQADWTIRAGIENLLDRRYRLHGSGIDAPGRNLFVNIQRLW